MRYAYYPGCSLEATAREYDLSVRAVCDHLGIELAEIPDWNCCGASSGHSTNRRLASTLAGRNLALAEEMKMDIAVACPACYIRLRSAQNEMKQDKKLRDELTRSADLSYDARYSTRHLLDIICNEIGLENLKNKVVKPLHGLKLAAYYGCYLVRPPDVVAFDDPENPQCLDTLLDTLGAEVRDWSGKVDCCGGSLSLSKRDIASQMVGELTEMARRAGAEAMVTACPLCHANLEMRQRGLNGNKLPVFYFTELIGLALGIKETRSWFKKHLISPSGLLTSLGL
ncbi:MAG: CoB--CoM heterodisulfide reductase iron-sulfur subunit B family protein [Chloroflexi bacterium]|nr:CoB--CoM heterodisulfide reductase iron-sulfur subunit B family protein [Chloroflexota bacterium]